MQSGRISEADAAMSLTSQSTPKLTAHYLRTLPAIRERCGRVFELAQQSKLQYFDYHPEKEADVIAFCANIIQRNFGSDFASIPPHGRWRHLDAGRPRVAPLLAKWASDPDPPGATEVCKRLVDLFLVSVLLDAGAGSAWTYREEASGGQFARSEGLGVASIAMFERGFFSSDASQPYRVDAKGLARITAASVAQALQVTAENPMVGIDGRASLLSNLGHALTTSPEFFGEGRPGDIIDFLEKESLLADKTRTVPIAALWHALIEGLAPIWPPARTTLGGVALGDVWPCAALKDTSATVLGEGDDLVPFHKLTGWITYSLIEPLEKILNWRFAGTEDLTGLPEYRNGGLLVDLGVLTLKPDALPTDDAGVPRVAPGHPAVVEWRAVTVIELDRIAAGLRNVLGPAATHLSLAQVLESATWIGGREIARVRRAGGGPPIDIISDGTVF